MRAIATTFLVVLLCGVTLAAGAGTALFPQPMHLHRTITDSVAGTTIDVDEYCAANRVVSVRGNRTVIVDYEKQEITEIDRETSTYSITRFEEIANAKESLKAASDVDDWTVDNSKPHTVTLRRKKSDEEVDVETDPSRTVTSGAIEVLIGSRYPNTSSSLSRAIARALDRGSEIRAESTADAGSSLPLSITHRYRLAEASAEVRNRITRIDSDALPPAVAEILPGYRRVESKLVVTARELRNLDSLHPLAREP